MRCWSKFVKRRNVYSRHVTIPIRPISIPIGLVGIDIGGYWYCYMPSLFFA